MIERWADLLDGYRISDHGRLYSPRSNAITCGTTRVDGYKALTVRSGSKKTVHLAHRLVAKAFVPGESTERPNVNHKDGNKCNNHYTNLEWCSTAENNQHAWANGLVQGTPGNPGATKLTTEQVAEFLKAFAQHGSIEQLRSDMGVHIRTVHSLLKGDLWKHITRPFDETFLQAVYSRNTPRGDGHKNTRISEDQLHQVRKALSEGETGRSIAKRFGVSATLISRIKNGKARTDTP